LTEIENGTNKWEEQMKNNELNQHDMEEHDRIKYQHNHVPYWKRMHHTWSFLVFAVLMLVAITYYVMSVDFAYAPQKELNQSPENNMTP
jgi:hypothetical protein